MQDGLFLVGELHHGLHQDGGRELSGVSVLQARIPPDEDEEEQKQHAEGASRRKKVRVLSSSGRSRTGSPQKEDQNCILRFDSSVSKKDGRGKAVPENNDSLLI